MVKISSLNAVNCNSHRYMLQLQVHFAVLVRGELKESARDGTRTCCGRSTTVPHHDGREPRVRDQSAAMEPRSIDSASSFQGGS
jgi:hypothetical protein